MTIIPPTITASETFPNRRCGMKALAPTLIRIVHRRDAESAEGTQIEGQVEKLGDLQITAAELTPIPGFSQRPPRSRPEPVEGSAVNLAFLPVNPAVLGARRDQFAKLGEVHLTFGKVGVGALFQSVIPKGRI